MQIVDHFTRELEYFLKVEPLELKNTITKIKNSVDELDAAEERI